MQIPTITPTITKTIKPTPPPIISYILHLSKTTQINSKLYFTPDINVSDADLISIVNKITITPELFTVKEGLLPDFNSCANSSTTTTIDSAGFKGSMLYITDCVAYPVYSAYYKNSVLVIQLRTDDDRSINAGYYRLVI